ncbi:hypothetical protein BaRGS_00028924, partial [Batillaria attramentaria]
VTPSQSPASPSKSQHVHVLEKTTPEAILQDELIPGELCCGAYGAYALCPELRHTRFVPDRHLDSCSVNVLYHTLCVEGVFDQGGRYAVCTRLQTNTIALAERCASDDRTDVGFVKQRRRERKRACGSLAFDLHVKPIRPTIPTGTSQPVPTPAPLLFVAALSVSSALR